LVAANPGFAPWAFLTRSFGAPDDQFPRFLLHSAEYIRFFEWESLFKRAELQTRAPSIYSVVYISCNGIMRPVPEEAGPIPNSTEAHQSWPSQADTCLPPRRSTSGPVSASKPVLCFTALCVWSSLLRLPPGPWTYGAPYSPRRFWKLVRWGSSPMFGVG